MIIPGISINSRVNAKLTPKEDNSNKNIGILVVDHAPIKDPLLLEKLQILELVLQQLKFHTIPIQIL